MSNQPFWVVFLGALGFLSLLSSSLSFIKWVLTTFLGPEKNLRSYGSWAMVTGATDGIGKALAFQLARKGFNLVLVGRNSGKLDRVSGAIRAESETTQMKTLTVDFSSDIFDGIRRIAAAIDGLDVGILINCAGVSYPAPLFFHQVSETVWKNVIRVNVEGLTKVTLAVLPGMMKRKKGAIVNIGSGAASLLPSFPLYAVYAASKAYIDQFSTSLSEEYRGTGIDVQCQIPLYVATKMVPFKKQSPFVPSPEKFAQAAVRLIGCGPRCTPYWLHSLQWYLAGFLPEAAISALLLEVVLRRRRKLEKGVSCQK